MLRGDKSGAGRGSHKGGGKGNSPKINAQARPTPRRPAPPRKKAQVQRQSSSTRH